MIKLDIFSKKYNSILHPFHLENLDQLSVFIKNKNSDLPFKELKKKTLEVLNFLLENDIVYVLEKDFMQNKEFIKSKLSNKYIIDEITNNWHEDTSWEDFYFMLWFKFQDWYRDKLVNMGLENKPIDWNEFICNNIGNFEKWIKKNKPK
jgi:hypothetical protein